ncbi:MAG TPA: BlaI/MecI/CopY family transcriptional regulator [Thermoanaerobaculia bacterium]|nr:BlaI/MecI/CopY family transcriptional regulator [Thermoanaerobaculia bacterium]
MALVLSRREREIVEIIFASGGEASAEQIRERLSDPPSYSAVRAMLAKLEAKGAVRHREEGVKYIYSPTIPRGTARRSAVRRLVDVFFEGSARQAASALLKDEKWSDEDLDRMAAEIERLRNERRS